MVFDGVIYGFEISEKIYNMSPLKGAVILILLIIESLAFYYDNIVIVILSQDNSYHKSNAELLKKNILQQSQSQEELKSSLVAIEVIPGEGAPVGYWTIVPIFPRLEKEYGNKSIWIYFCEENTVINLKKLFEGLRKFEKSKKRWIGFGLQDEQPTIIHHFAFSEFPNVFKYPLISAGLAITTTLIQHLNLKKESGLKKTSQFSIDASYELALYIGEEFPLQHMPSMFCDKPSDTCASFSKKISYCNPSFEINEIYFAVKTCDKFHLDRVPVVQKTWGREAEYITFFSDKRNESIPTVEVGVNNTERGHCQKTLNILKMVLKEVTERLKNVKWVVLADDDTLLSVRRLQAFLSCYNPDAAIGERYGYNAHNTNGYNYLTGGGGIALGIKTLSKLVGYCNCPQVDSPDDMVIGLCLASLNISLTHSPLFHQARPVDYPSSYLEIGYPLSFHKHWNIDPLDVYKKWLSTNAQEPFHTEL